MKTLKNKEIYGNWATLLLATDNDASVDYKRLSDEIDILIASNPNGIYSKKNIG